MTPPSLPEYIDKLDEAERTNEEYLYRCRLVHYNYVTSTEECNQPHYAAFTDPMYALRGRLFQHAGGPWEGETFELKLVLIEATEKWKELTGGGVPSLPCHVDIDAKDLRETTVLNRDLGIADMGFEFLQNMCGVGEESWVLTEDYECAVALLEEKEEEALAGAESAEEREEIMTHWPWDDMDEEKYM